MPRKKTGMPFEAHPSPLKAENGENLLYVKPLSGRTRTIQDMENLYADKYSLRRGDMTRVFDAFFEIAARWMADGYRIETPIGTFAPKIRLKRQVTDPDEVKHDDVELEGIDYQSIKPFEKELRLEIGSDGFRYIHKPVSSRLMSNMQYMEKALRKSIDANDGYTTVSSFAFYSGLTQHSARKQLNRWCYGDNPKLQRSRFGHAIIYTEI